MQHWGFVADGWTIAEELWLYGEDELADRATSLTDEELRRVWVGSGDVARGWKAGDPTSVGWALATAAVKVMEGEPRALRRTTILPFA